MGNKAGEGRSYNNLGCAYEALGQSSTAIEYHQRCLEIFKEVGDKDGEGKSYCLLGRINLRQKELETLRNIQRGGRQDWRGVLTLSAWKHF